MKKNSSGNDTNRKLYVKNCDALKELKIGPYSFSDYSVIEIENVNSLELIEIGEIDKVSYNFFYISLELKSEWWLLLLMNRFTEIEITSIW